jgi:hypothetical protein
MTPPPNQSPEPTAVPSSHSFGAKADAAAVAIHAASRYGSVVERPAAD